MIFRHFENTYIQNVILKYLGFYRIYGVLTQNFSFE